MDVRLDADAIYTVSASSIGGLLGYAQSLRIDTAAIVRDTGLTEEMLRDPEARLSQALNHRIWERVAVASRDADFGLHMAEHMSLDAFHVLGHLAAHSATLGDAFQRITAYSRLLHDSGRIEMERAGDDVTIFPGCRGLLHDWPRHIAEFSAASVVTLAKTITGVAWRPTRVGFKHAKPSSVSEHNRLFGAMLTFDADETFVTFSSALLKLPVIAAQAGLSTFLDAYARDLVAKLPADEKLDIATRVQRLIVEALHRGVPEIADISRMLAMTSRTLQRRLSESETSFQVLLDTARRNFAERYVLDGSLAFAEIAFLLGFADVSNFHRAFRRWTGMTPAELRETRRKAVTP